MTAKIMRRTNRSGQKSNLTEKESCRMFSFHLNVQSDGPAVIIVSETNHSSYHFCDNLISQNIIQQHASSPISIYIYTIKIPQDHKYLRTFTKNIKVNISNILLKDMARLATEARRSSRAVRRMGAAASVGVIWSSDHHQPLDHPDHSDHHDHHRPPGRRRRWWQVLSISLSSSLCFLSITSKCRSD